MDDSQVKVWNKDIQEATKENILSSLQKDLFQMDNRFSGN